MYRIPSTLTTNAGKKVVSIWLHKCQQTTQAGSSGGNKGVQAAILTATAVVAGAGGLVGYASYSNDNRKGVESTIAGSNNLFEALLGPLVEDVAPPPKADIPNIGLLNKKLERERQQREKQKLEKLAKERESKKGESEVKASSVPSPPLPTPPPPTAKAEKAKETDNIKAPAQPILPTLPTVNENELLAKVLEESLSLAKKHVSDALTAAENASKVVKAHAEKAYAAIDSEEGQEKLFAAAAEMSKLKSEMVKTAEDKVNKATQMLGELEKKVADGRNNKNTSANPVIRSAEDALSELSFVISRINNVVAVALRDGAVVGDFKEMLDAGRKQFETEVRSLLPEVKLGEKGTKLTSEEVNLLLAHAHRKVLTLQKAVARQHTVDKERGSSLTGADSADLDRQRHELNNEHRHRLNQLREDLESEMRTQLKRQAAAHSEHLADVLEVQQKDLERKYQNKEADAVQTEKDAHFKALSQIKGDVDGLKSAVKGRATADKAAYAAHELWLACESLRTALRLSSENASSWHEQLVPLHYQIKLIRQVAGPGDTFVDTILSTIPSESLKRGVYTEEALRERFMTVERVCKRVSMVGEEGGSLIRYLLSYVQSFLVVSAFESIPGKELRDDQIDMDSLDTFDILARARYCLNKDDFAMALRYMCLLKGEPRHVAEDWKREVRLTLEARQAADAVRAHAAAQGARAL